MRGRILILAGVLLYQATPAFAKKLLDDDPAPTPTEDSGMVVWTAVTWPTELNEQPLVMSANMFQIHLDAFVNLSDQAAGKPVAFAPDIFYGITDRLTVGLVHNVGLCVTGEMNGCAKVYNDVGLQARFLIKRTFNIELAALGGVEAVSLDPFALGIRLGALFKYKHGRLAIFVDPSFKIGATHRDGTTDPMTMMEVGANKETLAIPIRVSFQATNKIAAYARTGLTGAVATSPDLNPGARLDAFGDTYAIPLGIGAQFGIVPRFDVGLELAFPDLIWPGRPAGGAFDARELFVFADYRI